MRTAAKRAHAARGPDFVTIRAWLAFAVIAWMLFFVAIDRLPLAASWVLASVATLSAYAFLSRASSLWLFSLWAQTNGLFALVVTSDSPKWSKRIELDWLPRLSVHCAVLNWSQHQGWTHSRPVATFFAFVQAPTRLVRSRVLPGCPCANGSF
jgi:hypothetical protein